MAEYRRVVVTGVGAVTPVGNDVNSTWASLLAGRSGVERIRAFDPSHLKTQIAAEVKDFDPLVYMDYKEARRSDPYTQYAVAATAQALADAGLQVAQEDPRRVGVMIGSGIGGIQTILQQADVLRERGPRRISPFMIPSMLVDTAAGHIAIKYSLRGPNMAMVIACATGTGVIGEAVEIIRRGAADVMIAGGSEAAVCEIAVAGFEVMGALSTRNDAPHQACRPFDAQRDGFILGEGSGIVILEALEHAQQRGAHIYAEVLGYGITADAHHMAAPREDGVGALEAMQVALNQPGLPLDSVDYINAHGTGTILNDAAETRAIKNLFGEHAYDLAVSSTKSMTGHLMGAAGALEAIVCCKVVHDGIIPPTINHETPDPECDLDYVPNQARRADVRVAMSNSFGFGGHNATLVFGRMNGDA